MLIQDITSICSCILGILGLCIAFTQLLKLRKQINISLLLNVLSIEEEINLRKSKVDDIAHEIEVKLKTGNADTANLISIDEAYLNTALENWFNSLDRLCFCIKKGYFKEKDWKAEYRDYIVEMVKTYPDKFGVSSKYKNIIDLNEKWLRE